MRKEYDIRSIFEEMELELIRSMKRNLARHQKWESEEGINWTMWQAEQLKSFEKFKKQNEKIFKRRFSSVNMEIKEFLETTYETAGLDQEKEILNALLNDKKFKERTQKGLEGSFFQLNKKKMDALINATTSDLSKAEVAMLRMTNDQYRKIIYKAETMFNSGAFTLKQAIDAASRDFLKAGINCVEYKDGRRVNISTYAEMCLRTSNKRAKFAAEGDVRKSYGINTVKISRYGGCSETCLPWQGKVYIDDVWSGGSKEEAEEKNLPLLSTAIEGGLFHPNCKHTMFTYYYDRKKAFGQLQQDGIEVTPEEQEHRRNQLRIQQQKRLEEGSLDEKNIQEAKARKEAWVKQDEQLHLPSETNSSYVGAKTIEEAQEYASKYVESRPGDKTFKGQVNYKGISVENANKINKALADIYDNYDISKISGIKVVSSNSKVFKSGSDAIAAYDPVQHGIYLNKDILKSDKAFREYCQKSDEAWNLVMDNIDRLSGSQKEKALVYKNAGRSLVDEASIEGAITHEMGHHIQWNVLDTKTNNSIGSRMSQYAPKISGYANSSKGEYIAESFVAYLKGERDILDEEFVDFINAHRTNDIVANEFSPRKDTDGVFGVKWRIVKSPDYRKRLSELSNNNKVVDSIETRVNWALNNRDGLKSEELYAINLNTGEDIARITDQYHDFGVKRTREFTNKLKDADEKGIDIFLIHNHPRGLPPSIDDINALFTNIKVSGITVGHDGSIYYYSKPKETVPLIDYSVALRKYSMYNEIVGMEKALEDLSDKFGFVFKKI